MSYVRPHELEIVPRPADGTLAVTLSQALTVGPNTRLEFKRADDGSFVDVELPRADYLQLQDSGRINEGALLHLRARRLTRFSESAELDPAAMI